MKLAKVKAIWNPCRPSFDYDPSATSMLKFRVGSWVVACLVLATALIFQACGKSDDVVNLEMGAQRREQRLAALGKSTGEQIQALADTLRQERAAQNAQIEAALEAQKQQSEADLARQKQQFDDAQTALQTRLAGLMERQGQLAGELETQKKELLSQIVRLRREVENNHLAITGQLKILDRQMKIGVGQNRIQTESLSRLDEEFRQLGGKQERNQALVVRFDRRLAAQKKALAALQQSAKEQQEVLLQQLAEVENLLRSPLKGLPQRTIADREFREAFFFMISGQLDLAADAFNAFAVRFPEDKRVPEARYRIGQSYLLQRKYDLAVTTYFEFVDQHPKHELSDGGRWGLARSLEETGDLSLAREFYEDLIRRGSLYASDATRRVALINRYLPGARKTGNSATKPGTAKPGATK